MSTKPTSRFRAEYVGGGTVLFDTDSDTPRPRATAGIWCPTRVRKSLTDRGCHWQDTKAALDNRLRGEVAAQAVSRAERESQ
jgi:hypothetical protein